MPPSVNILATALTTAVATIFLVWALHSSQRLPALQDGRVVLRYAGIVKALLVVSAVLFLGLVVVSLYFALAPDATPEDAKGVALATPVGLLLGIPSALELRAQLTMDAEGIRGQTAWSGQREIRWDELSKVTYSPSMGWFVLHSSDGTVIRVSRGMRGHLTILDYFEVYVPDPIWRAARDKLERTSP